jgi:GNAT superfamily N-acetyltransferase
MAQGLVFVAANGERIVGVVILDYARWPWTHPNSESGRHLYNQHFWVDPAFRRGGTALKLRKMAEARADALGLPLLLQTSSLDSNTDLKDRFFAMGGFKRVGGNFYRMPKKG